MPEDAAWITCGDCSATDLGRPSRALHAPVPVMLFMLLSRCSSCRHASMMQQTPCRGPGAGSHRRMSLWTGRLCSIRDKAQENSARVGEGGWLIDFGRAMRSNGPRSMLLLLLFFSKARWWHRQGTP